MLIGSFQLDSEVALMKRSAIRGGLCLW